MSMGTVSSGIIRSHLMQQADAAGGGTGGAGGATDGNTWVLELNLAGVEPASGKGFGGPQVTKPGVYKAVIRSSERFVSEGGWYGVRFSCEIEGGEFDGYEQTVLLPAVPDAAKDPQGKKFAARWKALVLNVAKPETIASGVLEKNKIQFGPGSKSNPTGKSVFIFIRVPKEGDLDKKGYQKRPEAAFMAPAEAKAEMEAEAKLAARRAGQGAAGAAQGNGAQGNGVANGAAHTAPAAAPGPDPMAEI